MTHTVYAGMDHPADANVILAGYEPPVVYGSGDDGESRGKVYCAIKNGGVFSSGDRGSSWRYLPLPRGAGHVFSLALG